MIKVSLFSTLTNSLDFALTKVGKKYLQQADIQDHKILIKPSMGDYFFHKVSVAQQSNAGRKIDIFVDMLLDRTLALLKVASYYYIDKIVTAISRKYEADKKLTRQESVAHMK